MRHDRSRQAHEGLTATTFDVAYLRQQHIGYLLMRDYRRAEQHLDRILEIIPDDVTTYVDKVALDLYRSGDATRAEQYENTAPTPDYTAGIAATHMRWLAAVFAPNYTAALSILERSNEDRVFTNGESFVPKALLYPRTSSLDGDLELASQEFKLALKEIERLLETPK